MLKLKINTISAAIVTEILPTFYVIYPPTVNVKKFSFYENLNRQWVNTFCVKKVTF